MSFRFAPISRVRLTHGMFAERQAVHVRHLRAIDPERLLAPFREQAGLPQRVPRYGGWESRDIAGHSLGHYLSALAYLRAATGCDDALARVCRIVAGLDECQRANGGGYVLPVNREAFEALRYGRIEVTPFSLNGVWVPFYTLHKVLAGLRDAFRLCGDRMALSVAIGAGEWLFGLLDSLDASSIQRMLVAEHGGMNEVLADLAADAGDRRFIELAVRAFHHDQVLEPMFRGEDRLDGLHGNTQIPKVVGLAREYEIAGDPRCRIAAESFWLHVTGSRSYVIGGHGESEHFFPVEQFPHRLTPNTCETCNTYNLLKLARHLCEWSPDAGRMDFVERAMINHLAANIGRNPGEFGYFLGLGAVGVKVFSTPYDSWWCCVGTGLENPVRYGEMAYATNGRDLWVNLYMGSRFDWVEQGTVVEQETRFPDSDVVRIRVRCGAPRRFTLWLRHPGWCGVVSIRLNGDGHPVDSSPASYIPVDRVWVDGDELELRLPMTLRCEELPQSGGSVLALVHGPNVLAAEVPVPEGMANPAVLRFAEHLDARGKVDVFPPCLVAGDLDEVLAGLMADDGPSTFRSTGVLRPGDLRFVPLHRIDEEAYAVYFRRISPADWTAVRLEIEQVREEAHRLEAATFDHLLPGYQQPEVEHALQCFNSEVEDFAGRKGRLARDGGWFSYRLKVSPNEAVVLVVSYWGGVWHERVFDVLIDGVVIDTRRLLANRPGDFFETWHVLPLAMTVGKKSVTVCFQSRRGDVAGAVFGLRTARVSAMPSGRYEQAIVHKVH
jgi:uncharacterized protein